MKTLTLIVLLFVSSIMAVPSYPDELELSKRMGCSACCAAQLKRSEIQELRERGQNCCTCCLPDGCD
ncbi:hypothetical protein INT43_001660 [Umbelopsis isabellina]|uniref:Uncharacterized protein n=1 Tax=Mortierella isabellina TaxID=91625 RepID=A0A8H7PQX0_MORIS|nr:hypothetical protein INT43_001660 [Umbelopsis isabellina]